MRGFTLVEVLISISLFAIVAMFILGIFPTASVAIHRSGQEDTASGLAQSALESTLAQPYSTLTPGPQPSIQPVLIDGIAYQPQVVVSVLPPHATSLIVQLTATVTWQYGNVTHSVVRETSVANIPRN